MTDTLLNRYIPEPIRAWIEERYYARVNAQATLDEAIKDETLWIDTANHVALFSDHGVVHMRDVMRQILNVLDAVNGVLIPAQSPNRLESVMKGYGALVACLHDIGMADFSAFGRAMHPEFAAQAVFTAPFDDWIDRVWETHCGTLADELVALEAAGALCVPAKLALREMLALSMCHSKSKVPIALLNDPGRLKLLLQQVIQTNLQVLYAQHQKPDVLQTAQSGPESMRLYQQADFERVAFAWLTTEQGPMQRLRDEMFDVLRALRCADALRQRGTVLRTSGSYELFVNQQTANLVVALRDQHDNALLLELPGGGIGAGEANLASSELGHDGNLRISFQRGAFADTAAFNRAIADAVLVVNDIQADVISSFERGLTPGEVQQSRDIRIHLENTDDNPAFVEAVCEHLIHLAPEIAARVEIVPSLRYASALERDRYLASDDLNWDLDQRLNFLQQIADSGQKIDAIDPINAFRHIKQARLTSGEKLIEANAPSGFVYFPLEAGLWVMPLGGYQTIAVQPWRPLGNTGVIRGADRNADIAAQQAVRVLILPKDVYLRHWYRPFTVDELQTRLRVSSSDA
jgi:hypothetical protein